MGGEDDGDGDGGRWACKPPPRVGWVGGGKGKGGWRWRGEWGLFGGALFYFTMGFFIWLGLVVEQFRWIFQIPPYFFSLPISMGRFFIFFIFFLILIN